MDTNADILYDLPVDKTQPSHNELRIVNSIFKDNKKEMGSIFDEFKELIPIAVIFFLLSLPQLDVLIKKYFPFSNTSIYALLLTKTILFIIVFWLLKHFYLSKK